MRVWHHVENSIVIRCKLEDAYAIAKDVERYSEFIPGYEGSKVTERADNKAIIERIAEIMGRKILWKSVATFHPNERIEFEQIKGPLKGMIAKWFFEQVPEGAKIVVTHDFELETSIPDWPIEKVIAAVSGTADNALEALKKKIEG